MADLEALVAGGNGSVGLYYGDNRGQYSLQSIAYVPPGQDGVAVAAFNTRKNLHALTKNQQMESFLILEHCKRDPAVRALIWTATGEKAFNSGASFKPGSNTITLAESSIEAYADVGLAPAAADLVLAAQTKAFWDFPKPVVMAINGLAVGGGVNVALANFADVVIASTNARFMYPFAKLGITPELGSSLLLPHVVGIARAKRLLMVGDWFSADHAMAAGLVTGVHTPAALFGEAKRIATGLASRNPATMQLIKELVNRPLREQLDAVLENEQTAIMASISAMPNSLLSKL